MYDFLINNGRRFGRFKDIYTLGTIKLWMHSCEGVKLEPELGLEANTYRQMTYQKWILLLYSYSFGSEYGFPVRYFFSRLYDLRAGR